MGEIVPAAKITHVPSMSLPELPGPNQSCRDAAIRGHHQIGRRARAAGADTFSVPGQVAADSSVTAAPVEEPGQPTR